MAVLSVLNLLERTPTKRRTRGPRPRGPKPQVCDLCQLRKVKCDMGLPKCSLCTKLGRTCTYARDGFKDSLGKERHFLKWLASLARKRSQLLVGAGGEYIYLGHSMATHYLASNRRLLATATSTFVADFVEVAYNRQTPIDITRALTLQLVELYFGFLNNFFPLVDPSSFYSQLNTGRATFEFQLLFTAVCLSGASYYPHRVLGRLIALHFSKQLKTMLRQALFRPSLVAVQACILAAYHIGVCDDQDSVASAWFTLGVASSMASLLGIQRLPPKCPPAERQLRLRLRLFLSICDVSLANCFGRPRLGSEVAEARTVELPTLSFSHTAIFANSQVTQIRPEATAAFFRDFCHLHMLIDRRLRLAEAPAVREAPAFSLKNILCESPHPSLAGSLAIEDHAIRWYTRLPACLEQTLFLPSPDDMHTTVLAVLFFSLLVDLNKPFVAAGAELDALLPSFPVRVYRECSPLDKCIVATFLGAQVFRDAGQQMFDAAVPCVWYAAVQFTFMFLYLAKALPPTHWAVGPARDGVRFFYAHFERNADRWAILRDAFFTLKPLVGPL